MRGYGKGVRDEGLGTRGEGDGMRRVRKER